MEKDLETGLGGSASLSASNSKTSALPPAMEKETHNPNELNALSNAHINYISLSEVGPVDVQIRNLAVTVDVSPSVFDVKQRYLPANRKLWRDGTYQRSRQILHSVSASMPVGTLTAIIGGSGSGKTTMLNTMAERMTSNRITFSGTTTFNGMKGVNSIRSAYVMQQDILIPSLTVRETLRYAADLRLPPPTTEEQRRQVVEEVILELGLKECADTRIGTNQHKACSGGEKRRTSIGVQLLSNPSVLFLDEPTTGLDATSAFQLIRTLKGLATKGRTIITTIHQPRSEIWDLFDELVILTRGSPVYSGHAEECIPWFKKLGHELPEFVNPAEFLIDVAAIDNRSDQLEKESSDRVTMLKSAWAEEADRLYNAATEKETAVEPPHNKDSAHIISKRHSPFIRQTRVLISRTFVTTYRDPLGMIGSWIESILMGIISGWVFFDLKRDQSGIRSRQGVLYNGAALQGYLILIFECFRLSNDIKVFDREHNEKVVDVIPFLLSRRIARVFIEDIPVPLIYSIILYWMSGLEATASAFFTFFSVILLTQFMAVTFATTCVAAKREFAHAILIANLAYTVQSMACGFFIQSETIPVYVRWLKWTAYVFYGFGALSANEFNGSFYDCPYEGGETNPLCENYTGRYIMSSLGFHGDWKVMPICVMVAFAVGFYLLAWVGLSFIPVEMSIARQRGYDTDLSAGKEKMRVRSRAEARTVDIGLDKLALDLDKRNSWGKRLATKTILEPITTSFHAGMLNVIMGPSGSGKTSLLNAMALRLHNSPGTRYRSSGEMTFNGAVPSNSVIRSVVCYLCQDDEALLPYLTVRETLKFSARLRLPSFMTTAQKDQRADEVLLQLGLKDCADNLIGNESKKGISGGEKRRVSIAVQILTDPRVLLLDEPTSGLDAFTATSIMDVLQGLADEGRTLILSIHQSRSDLFKRFGTILLLARGGSTVYAGKGADMLHHFAYLGFPCPKTTNPADFALDLITVDLQQAEREKKSRAVVRRLVTSWSSGGMPASTPGSLSTPAELGAMIRKPRNFVSAYPILCVRAFTNFRRQAEVFVARITQVLGLGVILTLFFAPLKHDYFAIQTRIGFAQEFCAFYFVGMLQNVAVYPAEKAVFYREHDDGVYSVEAFFVEYSTLEIPFEIFTSLIFAILVDLAAGLERTPQVFFVCFFNCFCIVNCGESLGIAFNTIFPNTGFAVQLTSVFLSIAQFMSGVMSTDMPVFLKAMNCLSPIRYAIRNLAPYTLRGIKFYCTPDQSLPDGSCPITTGEQVLELYHLDENPALNIMALGICMVVYRLLAYALLKYNRSHWDWRGKDKKAVVAAKREKNATDTTGGEHTGGESGSASERVAE